jgi:NADH-quinone oxidoreductase subunit E
MTAATTHDRGVCIICRRRDACMLAVEPGHPVWTCAEFEPLAASGGPLPPHLAALAARGSAGPAEDLCSSCESRAGCDFPRPEGGVWHCEGYSWNPRRDDAANQFDLKRGAWTMPEIVRIVEKHRGERGELIAILGDIQAKYSYLPADALKVVADQTGRSLVDIYGVATFYRAFSLKPRGRHLLTCCVGTACHVRGAPRVVQELQRQLGVRPGDTTADREFTLETQNCLGGCALGPIVVADGHYFSNIDPTRVADILGRTRAGLDRVDVTTDQRVFPLDVSCSRCNHSLMDAANPIDGHPSVRVTISFADRHGWLLLSSLYGSYTLASEHEIPADTVADFFCPHCHAELKGASDCIDCGAPMVPMIVRGGGIVQICSRRGCRAHMLDLTDVNVPAGATGRTR